MNVKNSGSKRIFYFRLIKYNINYISDLFIRFIIIILILNKFISLGDWGLGIGDWGLGPIPNPQSPIPNPQLSFENINYL
jgi:hypothetical protein